jgi:signal transduction histidine kinase
MLRTPGPPWHWVFWQSLDTNTPPRNPLELQVGDKLQVVGFPETGGEAPVLTEALIRKVGRVAPEPPVEAKLSEVLLGRHDSALVSLEGWVLGREIVGRDLILELQSGEKVFQAILRGNSRALANLAPASRVRVTGVCQVEPVPYAELGKRVGAFKLLLRSPADVGILERPPWWTLKHTLMAGGALAAALAAAAGWIGTLRRQVEERTKRLKHEIEEHRKTEAQLAGETRRVQLEIEEHKRTEQSLAEKTELLKGEIDERKRIQAEFEGVHRQLLVSSRLAGMAEVATSVLHNVGNVLNGANLLAAALEKQVQKSEAAGVSRLAALLAEHQADLGQFLAREERGKLVCGHLGRLGTQLEGEQSRMIEKIRLLSESIQHIKEIVAMQQNHTRIYGLTETVALAEVVEDAMQMCSGALAWPELELVRDYGPLPPVVLDRHRVLQILFNLLENARYACEAQGGAGRISVRLRVNGQDRVQAQVTDNGIGISAENLPRIFTQGFSTRKGGHGFGLHSSILAAQDMGGSLTVQSGGPGCGATFTLELPVARRDVPQVGGKGATSVRVQ